MITITTSLRRCIYIIDPDSIMTAGARRQLSTLAPKTRSETTLSHPPPDTPSLTDDSQDDSDNEDAPDEAAHEQLTMSPAELRVIRRIAARANVLPVIGRSDSLTDEKLKAIKEAVRRDLVRADLDFGVFVPAKPKPTDAATATPERRNGRDAADTGTGTDSDDDDDDDDDEEEKAQPERKSRPVIKLRSGSFSMRRSSSRSRTRRELTTDTRGPAVPDPQDRESVANVRFSAPAVARADLSALLPFALIAPEPSRRRHRRTREASGAAAAAAGPSEDGHTTESASTSALQSPVSLSGRSGRSAAAAAAALPYSQGPPEDLKGVFTRTFRWGTVDVLEPAHCDFAALRTAVLSTHMKVRGRGAALMVLVFGLANGS